MMASYDIPPSIEVFRLGECDNIASNRGYQPPIAVVSSFDLETVRSYPGITANASMNSFTTQWSTATAQVSNTTKRRSEKKHKKREFRQFVKILMEVVKKRDKGTFQNAKAVICNCEQQKRRGEIESVSESLRCPLKHAVGPHFWSEARERLSEVLSHSKPKRSSCGATIESDTNALDTSKPIQDEKEGYSQLPAMLESKTCAKNNATIAKIKEMKIRKKRIWMVIRVFMQYLRNKDCQLYRKAHTLVNECFLQHRRVGHFEHCNSLSGSIQACLKKEFGLERWKRAEYFVSEILLARHEDRR